MKNQILIVEDSRTQAEFLKLLLEENGYKVAKALNGKEALDSVRRSKPHLIISDINMPVMDGFELCHRIKFDEGLKEIPVMLLTSFSDPSDVIRGLEVVADYYLTKPCNEEYLLSKVRSILSAPAPQYREEIQEGLEITFDGKSHTINTNRHQMLNLLLSTYENAAETNRQLTETQSELEALNKQLKLKLYELKVSEERFRSLVLTIPDIVYRIDQDGSFTFLNSAIEQLGYAPEDLIGEHFSKIINPTDVEKISLSAVTKRYKGNKTSAEDSPKFFDERRTGDRKTSGLEVRLVTKKRKIKTGIIEPIGEEMIVAEVNSTGMWGGSLDSNRKVFIGTVGVIRDITDRKKLEDGLRKAHNELEIKVREKTKDLFEANKDLRLEVVGHKRTADELRLRETELIETQAQLIQTEKIGALGTMTAGIAHELNNPMMGMLNFIQYCIRHTEEEDKRYAILKDTEREIKRCASIVNNLLTFSRIEKEGEEKLQKMSITTLFERVLRLLAYRIEKENISISQHVDERTPEIMMKVSNLQQVVLNLLGNALDAVRESDKKEIRIGVRPENGSVQVIVSDSGCGIPSEILPRIFDPFFTTKPTGKGTGLGLSVSRSIIKDHGGEITCESKEGVGITFKLTLPIEQN